MRICPLTEHEELIVGLILDRCRNGSSGRHCISRTKETRIWGTGFTIKLFDTNGPFTIKIIHEVTFIIEYCYYSMVQVNSERHDQCRNVKFQKNFLGFVCPNNKESYLQKNQNFIQLPLENISLINY